MLPQSTARFYRSQQRLKDATLAAVRREWSRMGPDFDASWLTVGPRLVTLSSAAQLGAARSGASYVPLALSETGQDVDPLAEVDPLAFAGYSADGRSLDGLLYGAVTTAKTASTDTGYQSGLAKGSAWLDMAVSTLVADAGRQASGAGIAVRPRIGWVRMVNPPCCSRCAVLAGKFFRYNQGFRRHPRCDCTHIPSREDRADDFRTDPQALVREGQVRGLTRVESRALADGADVSQVVNARRGSSGLRSMTTTEGTTRRGVAGARLQGRARMTPEAIYRLSSSRDEAVDMLRAHGYVL